MINFIISILSIYGISFLIKEVDGPWGLISWFRHKLMSNKYIGVFFYKLISCYFCVGFYSGLIVRSLQHEVFDLNSFILWGLSGAVISLFGNSIFKFLNK